MYVYIYVYTYTHILTLTAYLQVAYIRAMCSRSTHGSPRPGTACFAELHAGKTNVMLQNSCGPCPKTIIHMGGGSAGGGGLRYPRLNLGTFLS